MLIDRLCQNVNGFKRTEMEPREWTVREDQMAVFLFGVLPVSELRSKLKLLPRRSPAEIYSRYLEIMSDVSLQERILAEEGEVLAMKSAIKWQPNELLSVALVSANDWESDERSLYTKCPSLYHPSRSPGSMSSICTRFNMKENDGLEQQKKRYLSHADSIRARISDMELVELDAAETDPPKKPQPVYTSRISPLPQVMTTAMVNYARPIIEPRFLPIVERKEPKLDWQIPSLGGDDSGDLVMPILDQESPSESPEGSRENMLTKIKQQARMKMKPNDLAGFVGRMGMTPMTKAVVTLGRATPLTHPDVDLAGYCIQSIGRIHCKVSLKADLNFYLECIGRDVIIDGMLFRHGSKIKLNDGSLIDVGVPLLFVENIDFLEKLREARM